MPKNTSDIPRKDQIFTAAEKLFREKGYLATSVRDIGKAVDIRGASLYHHIGGKEELLWAIATHAADQFFAALQPIMVADMATPLKLRRAVIAHVEVIAHNLNAASVYFNEWRHLPPDQRVAYAVRRDEYENYFRQILWQGQREGLFNVPDEKFAARFVLSALNWTHQWYRPDGPMTPDEIGNTLADLVMNGLTRTV